MSDSVLMVEEYENAVTYTAQSANKNSRREQMAVLAIAVAVVVNTVMEIAKVRGRERKKKAVAMIPVGILSQVYPKERAMRSRVCVCLLLK